MCVYCPQPYSRSLDAREPMEGGGGKERVMGNKYDQRLLSTHMKVS
jgi:hypothetical protein